jgi:6-phosphofructokinase 1
VYFRIKSRFSPANNTIYQKLGYLVRSGAADMLDRKVAMNYGGLLCSLTMKNNFGHLVCYH